MSEIIIADVKSLNIGGKATGHYFTVAKNYLEMFTGKSRVTVAGGPLYAQYFPKDVLYVLPYDSIIGRSGIVNKIKVIANAWHLIHKFNGKTIVMQSNAIATTFFALALYPGNPHVFMIQYNHMSLDSSVKRLLFRLAKPKIKGIICPSEEIGSAYSQHYHVVPDYVFTKQQYALLPAVDSPKTYDICIVGIMTEDKGVVEAATFFAGTEYNVIIAGKPVNKEIEQKMHQLCDTASNITLICGYIDNQEYDAIIRSSRFCVLNYTQAYSSHSSGVVFDVLYRGTPVIGRECAFLDFVAEKNIGIIYQDLADVDFSQALEESAAYCDRLHQYLQQQMEASDKLLRFLEEE